MTAKRFTRAGLAMGLALVLFRPAPAEEAARRRWIPGVADVQKTLAEGNREQAVEWIDEIAAEAPTGSLADRLVPLQNLLLQVGDDVARSRLETWIARGLATEEAAAFMKARMEPSRKAFEDVLGRFPGHRF